MHTHPLSFLTMDKMQLATSGTRRHDFAAMMDSNLKGELE